MLRSRGSDVPQRLSPRAPLHFKTTCSEANGIHRPIIDRSPKLEDRRSPRSPLHEKKRGTRVTELETKLGKAQEELKKLREQLASAEAAKLDAEQALEKAKKHIPALTLTPKETEEEKSPLPEDPEGTMEQQQEAKPEENNISSPVTTDVFEVVVQNGKLMNKENEDANSQKEEKEETVLKTEDDTTTVIVKEKVGDANDNIAVEKEKDEEEFQLKEHPVSPEMIELKAKLVEKEKEIEILLEENIIFKTKAKEEADGIATAARVKEEELVSKLRVMEEELKESRAKVERLEDQLEAAEQRKVTIEADMKRLKVQTDQWRKAAEAAAAVLATSNGTGMGGRRVEDRCGSMDKHLAGGYVGWESSLMAGDMEEDGMMMGGGRRKGTGMRMFGDLWKKKGQLN